MWRSRTRPAWTASGLRGRPPPGRPPLPGAPASQQWSRALPEQSPKVPASRPSIGRLSSCSGSWQRPATPMPSRACSTATTPKALCRRLWSWPGEWRIQHSKRNPRLIQQFDRPQELLADRSEPVQRFPDDGCKRDCQLDEAHCL